MTASRARDAMGAPTLRDAAKVAGWGLLFWAAAQYAGNALERSAIAALAVQALLAEWGAGRMGVSWSDPLAPAPGGAQIARRAGAGAALGAAVAALAVGATLIARQATLVEATFGGGLLGVGLVAALLTAARDELLLRGTVLRATRNLLPWWVSVLGAGLASAAVRYGVEGAHAGAPLALAVLLEGLRGASLASLWLRDRGAWMAVGASAAWTWVTGSVVRGGLLDVRSVTEGDASVPAVLVVMAAAVGAVIWARRRL